MGSTMPKTWVYINQNAWYHFLDEDNLQLSDVCNHIIFSKRNWYMSLKIFWWQGSIKSSVAGSFVRRFKYSDVAETSCISAMIETFISERLVYLNHLLQLSTRDFIEIDIVCHFWNRFCLSLLKLILSVTSEIDIVYHFWNRYCLSLLKSILSVTSEIDILCHFWNQYCLSLSITSASSIVWCSGKQMNTTGSQIAQNGLERRVYCVGLVQG
jgi:hypothetical protein